MRTAALVTACALLFTTTTLAQSASVELAIKRTALVPGATVFFQVRAPSLPSAGPTQVHLFLGTSGTASVVGLNGLDLLVPVGGTVSVAASGVVVGGRFSGSFTVPTDPALLGATLHAVAVTAGGQSLTLSMPQGIGPILEEGVL